VARRRTAETPKMTMIITKRVRVHKNKLLTFDKNRNKVRFEKKKVFLFSFHPVHFKGFLVSHLP